MEGRHFAAGPWFAVLETGADWHELDRVHLSNGDEHTLVRVELKVRLED